MNKKAFTLVEILLYVSLVSIIIFTIATFFRTLIQVQTRNEVTQEVDTYGNQLITLMTKSISDSTNVISPIAGSSQNRIELTRIEGARSPTIIELNSGNLSISEGGSNVNLNSNRVIIQELIFTNLTPTINQGEVVRIQLTISHVNPDNIQEKNYTQTLYATATIR